jgi:hypothetical protein
MKLPKSKYWYHATSIDNAQSIIRDGVLKSALDGIYFANTDQNAGNLCRMRGLDEWAVIKVPREMIQDKLERSYDHCFRLPAGCHFAVYRGKEVAVNDKMVNYWEATE